MKATRSTVRTRAKSMYNLILLQLEAKSLAIDIRKSFLDMIINLKTVPTKIDITVIK